MKMKRFHWALSALVLGIPIRASAKCGGVNYSWGADALASMHDYVVTMMLYVLYLLYAIAAIVAVISALQIYIKINAGRRSDEIHYDVSRRMSVHHWSFYRVSGILRVSDMVGVRFRITVSDR